MNLLFQTAKPRRFSHTMVYCDERRDRLRRLEAQARRELGMAPDPQPVPQPGSSLRPDGCPRADLRLGIHRGEVARRRSLVPSMAVVTLLLVIILACLLPWL